jgi:hypothetical protein
MISPTFEASHLNAVAKFRRWLIRSAVFDKLHAYHQTKSAHIANAVILLCNCLRPAFR